MRAAVLTVVVILVSVLPALIQGGGEPHRTLLVVIERSMPLIPLGLAVALVISCGDIDLSAAGLYGFLGMLVLWLSDTGIGAGLAFFCAFIVAIVIGVYQGWAVAFRDVAPLVVTLGTSLLFLGAAVILQVTLQKNSNAYREQQVAVLQRSSGDEGAKLVAGERPTERTLAPQNRVAMFSRSEPWIIGILIAVCVWRYRSFSGLRHVAVGLDRTAALDTGIDVRAIRFLSFVSAAVLVYLSAMLCLVGYNAGGWSAVSGAGLELSAIAAAVIGGTAISGGRFSPLPVALGVCVLGSLEHVCYRLGNPEAKSLMLGILLSIVAFSDATARSQSKSAS